MAKFLVLSTYTPEGLRGVLRDGGTARRQAVEELVASLGGKLEALYFAFGEYDFVAIIDGHDNVTQAAGNMIVAASGAATMRTVVLLTPEEMDQVSQIGAKFRPPGM